MTGSTSFEVRTPHAEDEIEFMYSSGEVFRDVKVALDERPVDGQLCRLCRQLLRSPMFNLLPHWIKIPLHPADSDFHRDHIAADLKRSRQSVGAIGFGKHVQRIGASGTTALLCLLG